MRVTDSGTEREKAVFVGRRDSDMREEIIRMHMIRCTIEGKNDMMKQAPEKAPGKR